MITVKDMVKLKKAFTALTKDGILQTYISDHEFRSSNNDNDIGYNLYVFDIRYQENLEPAQPNKVEFEFSENIPAGKYGYALLIGNKMVSITSDGQRHHNLI